MSQIVLDAIAADLALLTREVPVPDGDLGYGTDLSCSTELDPYMATVDPLSTVGISQAIVRRLITPRGSLPDDADYGIDIRSRANRGQTAAEINELAGQIRAEVTKDDRIASVTVTVVPSLTSLDIALRVTPEDVDTGDFALTLSVTDGAVLIEELL